MIRRIGSILTPAAALITSASAQQYQVITDEHSDLQIVYANGSISGRVHPEGRSYDPGTVLLFDGPSGTTGVQRPIGTEWDFLGVGAGQTLYYLPQGATPDEDRIYLGFASDKNTVPLGTFTTYLEADPRVGYTAAWIKISLEAVRFQPAPGESAGPAYFSLWQNDFEGNTTVWMSSFEGGITEEDATWLLAGGHEHFNWGFSKRGYYQLDFKFSGYLNDGHSTLLESGPVTYHFGVEYMPAAIPEPGTAALLLSGVVLLTPRRLMARSRPDARGKILQRL